MSVVGDLVVAEVWDAKANGSWGEWEAGGAVAVVEEPKLRPEKPEFILSNAEEVVEV